MGKKTAVDARDRALRAALRDTRTAWRRTEAAMKSLMHANKALLVSLGQAGAVAARRARGELAFAVKSLEISGLEAKRKFEELAREHAATPQPARTPPARPRARTAARRTR